MTFNKYYIVVRNKKWIAIYVTFEIPNLKTVYLKKTYKLIFIWNHILFCLKGCYAALKDEIKTYGNIFVGVGITILLVEVNIYPQRFDIAAHFNLNSFYQICVCYKCLWNLINIIFSYWQFCLHL